MPVCAPKFKFIHVVDANASQRSRSLLIQEARQHTARVLAAERDRIDTQASKTNNSNPDARVDDEAHDAKPDASQEPETQILIPLFDYSARNQVWFRPFKETLHQLDQPNAFVFRVRRMELSPFAIYCFSHEAYFSAMAARMEALRSPDDCLDCHSRVTPSVLRCKVRAIQCIREALSRENELDIPVLMAIMQLGMLELALNNFTQANLHRKAAILITERNFASHPLATKYTYRYRVWHDMSVALMQSPTLLPPPEADDPSNPTNSPTCLHWSLLERLPEGFRAVAEKGSLSVNILDILDRVIELQRGYKSLQGQTYPDLWSACPFLRESGDNGGRGEEPDINHLLAMALWLYVAIEFCIRPVYDVKLVFFFVTHQWIRQNLTNKLMMCKAKRPKEEERCLLWLVEVAIGSWRVSQEGISDQVQSLVMFKRKRFGASQCNPEKFFGFGDKWFGNQQHQQQQQHD